MTIMFALFTAVIASYHPCKASGSEMKPATDFKSLIENVTDANVTACSWSGCTLYRWNSGKDMLCELQCPGKPCSIATYASGIWPGGENNPSGMTNMDGTGVDTTNKRYSWTNGQIPASSDHGGHKVAYENNTCAVQTEVQMHSSGSVYISLCHWDKAPTSGTKHNAAIFVKIGGAGSSDISGGDTKKPEDTDTESSGDDAEDNNLLQIILIVAGSVIVLLVCAVAIWKTMGSKGPTEAKPKEPITPKEPTAGPNGPTVDEGVKPIAPPKPKTDAPTPEARLRPKGPVKKDASSTTPSSPETARLRQPKGPMKKDATGSTPSTDHARLRAKGPAKKDGSSTLATHQKRAKEQKKADVK